MKTEYGAAVKAILLHNCLCERIYQFFELLYSPAVYSQLCAGTVRVYGISVTVKKLADAAVNDSGALWQVGNLHDWPFQKIAHAVYERIVVDDV